MMLNSTFRFSASPNNKYLGGFQKFKNKKLLPALLFLCSHAPFSWMSPLQKARCSTVIPTFLPCKGMEGRDMPRTTLPLFLHKFI